MDIQVRYSWIDCFLGALLCLTVPLDWLIAGILAACVHELCHMGTVRFLGGRIHSLHIGGAGAIFETTPMEPFREFICVLAGPAGSFALLALSQICPKLALCGLVQGMFNMMPVYPLDGGRALSCAARALLSSQKAGWVCLTVRRLTVLVLIVLSMMGIFVYKLGAFSVIFILLLLCRTAFGKIPCNADELGVQYGYHL